MIIFNNQAEFDSLLSNINSFSNQKNNTTNKKIRNELAKHIKIVEDIEFEKRLDDLQNELAELEEIKDDLTVKLCYTRKDLCVELQKKFKREISVEINEEITKEITKDLGEVSKEMNKDVGWCAIDGCKYATEDINQLQINHKEDTQQEIHFDKIKCEIEKTKKLLKEEVNKKATVNFDVYKSAEMYFDSL
ncbi:hypothetical protein BDAP_002300 [Binucleata daphniae]